MKLIIKDDDDRTTVVPLVRDEISIGRGDRNTIRLTERNISRNHAKLLREGGAIYIQDLGSYNGVKVNGEKITSKSLVHEGDQISIGDYFLELEGVPAKDEDTNPTAPAHVAPPADRTPPLAVPAPQPRPQPAPPPPNAPPAAARKTPDGATAMIRLSDLQRPSEPDEVRALAAHEQPRIVALSGTLRGREFALRSSVVKFGRTEDGNDIVIDHQSVSRQHGRFQLEQGQWKIFDNKSQNGIRVNGEEYGMSPVRAGDTIELGHVKFRILAPGEQFSLPKESVAPLTGSGTRIEPLPPPPSRTGLYIGIGVAVLALVGVGAALALRGGGKDGGKGSTDAADDPCALGHSAIVAENWESAVKQLGIAKTLGKSCSFPVDAALENAKRNSEAKTARDEARAALDAQQWAKAVNVVKGAPAGSALETELKSIEKRAREGGAAVLAAKIARDIDDGRMGDAKNGIDDLATLDPTNPQLETLTGRFNEKKREKDREKDREREREREETRKAAAPPPPPKKSIEERNKEAEQKLQEAVSKIKGGDLPGGIGLLEAVVKLDPEKAYLCKAHRNLGVAYQKSEKKSDAVRNYKAYLKCDPNAPDREKVEKAIADAQ